MELSSCLEANSRSSGQKFQAFYVIRKFITVFTRARYWSLPQPDEFS